MTFRAPLMQQSQVVDDQLRWTPDWYTWLRDLFESRVLGTSTFGGGTSVPVVFNPPQPDGNYTITADSPEDNYFWATAKTGAGFTLNAKNTTSATVRWVLSR